MALRRGGVRSLLAHLWRVAMAVTFPLWGVPVAILGFAGERGDRVALRRVNPSFCPTQTVPCGHSLSLHLCPAEQPRPPLLTLCPAYGDTSPCPCPLHGGDTEAEIIMFRGYLVTEVGFLPRNPGHLTLSLLLQGPQTAGGLGVPWIPLLPLGNLHSLGSPTWTPSCRPPLRRGVGTGPASPGQRGPLRVCLAVSGVQGRGGLCAADRGGVRGGRSHGCHGVALCCIGDRVLLSFWPRPPPRGSGLQAGSTMDTAQLWGVRLL